MALPKLTIPEIGRQRSLFSGPIFRQRRHQAPREANFAVVLPRYGQTALRHVIYIGAENSCTPERLQAALQRAIDLRKAAEIAYGEAATRAMCESAHAGCSESPSKAQPPRRV